MPRKLPPLFEEIEDEYTRQSPGNLSNATSAGSPNLTDTDKEVASYLGTGLYKTYPDLSAIFGVEEGRFEGGQDPESNTPKPFEDEFISLFKKSAKLDETYEVLQKEEDNASENIDDKVVWEEDFSGPAVTVREIKETLALAKAIIYNNMRESNDMKEIGNLHYEAEEA